MTIPEASDFEQSLVGLLPRDRVAMIEDRDEAMYQKGYSAAKREARTADKPAIDPEQRKL